MSKSIFVLTILFCACLVAVGQNAVGQENKDNQANQQDQEGAQNEGDESIGDKAEDLKKQAEKKVDEIKESVDKNEDAKEAAESILSPIYKLVESFESVSYFYWIAFALMSAGVISYALQLVLGKLFMLFKGRFSIAEVLSDGLGLVISLVGIGLTTQAATENSQFTESAALVLSSAVVGAILGILMFMWGVSLEAKAAKSR